MNDDKKGQFAVRVSAVFLMDNEAEAQNFKKHMGMHLTEIAKVTGYEGGCNVAVIQAPLGRVNDTIPAPAPVPDATLN